jgi:hypothetical protein
METIYMSCAAIGGTLIVCQFLLTLLGLGGHHDVGGGHDLAGHDACGHHEAGQDHDSEPNWFFSQLTFRTLSATFAFFGLAGLSAIRFELEPALGLLIAVAAGAVAFLVVGWLIRLLSRLNIDGTVRIERAVGSAGTVYLSIPGAKAGAGKVHVNQHNRIVEYKAISAQEPLPTGAKIVVVRIVNADTVEVALAIESERTTHA